MTKHYCHSMHSRLPKRWMEKAKNCVISRQRNQNKSINQSSQRTNTMNKSVWSIWITFFVIIKWPSLKAGNTFAYDWHWLLFSFIHKKIFYKMLICKSYHNCKKVTSQSFIIWNITAHYKIYKIFQKLENIFFYDHYYASSINAACTFFVWSQFHQHFTRKFFVRKFV